MKEVEQIKEMYRRCVYMTVVKGVKRFGGTL